ncbi:MAG: hypothetical protein AAF368_02340 [Planctomycetota bacterium]
MKLFPVLSVFAGFLFVAPLAGAQSLSTAATVQTSPAVLTPGPVSPLTPIYRLNASSGWVEGCFPPCLCPLQISPDFRGTFELRRLPTLNPFADVWAVEDVNWIVERNGNLDRVIGEGFYTRYGSGLAARQQLVLNLIIGSEDNAVQVFDSGIVPGGGSGSLPKIDISIDENDLECFDTQIQLRATPLRRNQIVNFDLGGMSTYQEGCLPPCLCPLFQEQQVLGTFGLVRLPSLSASPSPVNRSVFGIVRVDWALLPPPSPLPFFTPIDGSGVLVYTNQAITPPGGQEQQMILDLSVGGDADRWDSGVVQTAPALPRIQLDLASNGFFCFDRVFSLDAAPL